MTTTLNEQGLKELSKADEAIAKLKPYLSLKVKGVDDKEGIKEVHEARMEVKNFRVQVEKDRKELKSGAVAFGKRVDAVANQIKAEIEPIEKHLIHEESIIEREKERLAAIAKEAAKQKLKARMDALGSVGAMMMIGEIEAMSDDAFGIVIAARRKEFEDRQAAELAERQRIEAEREQHRKEREALEAERAKQQAEREKIEAESRRLTAERQKIEDEKTARELIARKEQEESARIEREKIAAERASIAAKERELAETKRKLEQDAIDRANAAKAEQERIERERIAQEKAEEERRRLEAVEAAKAPDKVKLASLADSLSKIDLPEVASDDAKKLVDKTWQTLNQLAMELKGWK